MSPALPPSDENPAKALDAKLVALASRIEKLESIEDSVVAFVRGIAEAFDDAADHSREAVDLLCKMLTLNAKELGQSITDGTPFAAPAVSPGRAQMGGTKAKR